MRRFLDLIGELIVDVALYMRARTGECSIPVNRMVEHVDPTMLFHANCSVQMISPKSYREMQLPVEKRMAERIQPYGIHHCGDNLHKSRPNLCRTAAGDGRCRLGLGRGRGQGSPARHLSQPAPQSGAYAARYAAGDRRGYRRIARARPALWKTWASAASIWIMARLTKISSPCTRWCNDLDERTDISDIGVERETYDNTLESI